MIMLALAPPSIAVVSFDHRCTTPTPHVATGRPGSSLHRSPSKQAFNAPRQQTASVEIPIASDARPRHTSRGFLPWRFAYAGPGVRGATIMGPASANLHNFGSRPDLLDAEVAGFSKCDSRNTMHGPLKGVLAKDLESAAMVRERDDWGYYVRAIRDLTRPPSWRWRIIRRGKPMGVLLEARG